VEEEQEIRNFFLLDLFTALEGPTLQRCRPLKAGYFVVFIFYSRIDCWGRRSRKVEEEQETPK